MKTKHINRVTYTRTVNGQRFEDTKDFPSGKRMGYIAAERQLRKLGHVGAIAIRIETLVDAR